MAELNEGAAAKVTSIFIYPIKSCRGISVSQAPISPTGTSLITHSLKFQSFSNFFILDSCCLYACVCVDIEREKKKIQLKFHVSWCYIWHVSGFSFFVVAIF